MSGDKVELPRIGETLKGELLKEHALKPTEANEKNVLPTAEDVKQEKTHQSILSGVLTHPLFCCAIKIYSLIDQLSINIWKIYYCNLNLWEMADLTNFAVINQFCNFSTKKKKKLEGLILCEPSGINFFLSNVHLKTQELEF